MKNIKYNHWNTVSFLATSLLCLGLITGNASTELLSLLTIESHTVDPDRIFEALFIVPLVACAVVAYKSTKVLIEGRLHQAYMDGYLDGGKPMLALFTPEEIAMKTMYKEMQVRELKNLEEQKSHNE